MLQKVHEITVDGKTYISGLDTQVLLNIQNSAYLNVLINKQILTAIYIGRSKFFEKSTIIAYAEKQAKFQMARAQARGVYHAR